MGEVGGSGTRIARAVDHEETPALVCASCRGDTPLASLQPEVEPPRCRHCGTRFPEFDALASSDIDLRPTVRALIRALDTGDLRAAAALLCADVIWQEEPEGPSVVGRDAVVEHWKRSNVRCSVGELEMSEDFVVGFVVGLVLEHDVINGSERLVKWFVGFRGELIRSCWMWPLGRDDVPGRREA